MGERTIGWLVFVAYMLVCGLGAYSMPGFRMAFGALAAFGTVIVAISIAADRLSSHPGS